MKQYVHPINWMVAHGFKTDFAEWYKISNWKWLLVFWDEWTSENILLDFWFIEKEEETDTDTKWIDDAIEDMHIDDYINDPYRESLRFYIKKAILSHLPKQWK